MGMGLWVVSIVAVGADVSDGDLGLIFLIGQFSFNIAGR